MRALGQSEILARALGRDDENAVAIVCECEARAKADQSTAKTRAESAQPLEARRAALRQCCGEARNLRDGRMRRLEFNRCCSGRRGRVEDRRGDRVGPKNALRVGGPQPYWRRAQGVCRKPRVAQPAELELFVHCQGRTDYG